MTEIPTDDLLGGLKHAAERSGEASAHSAAPRPNRQSRIPAEGGCAILSDMRLSYDEENDLAYLNLYDLPENRRNVGHSVAVESEHEHGEIVLDFNLEGHLVGVEVFNARHQLPPEAFDQVDSK